MSLSMYERISEVVQPYSDRVMLCLETAADYLGLTNGVDFEDVYRVYSDEQIDDNRIETFILQDYREKQSIVVDGLLITSREQTLIDLLEHEDIVDIQALLESLSNYYYEHNESFDSLEVSMTTSQLLLLNKWRADAIAYYSED